MCFGEYVDTIYFVATGALEVKSGDNIMGLIGLYFSFSYWKILKSIEKFNWGEAGRSILYNM